MKKILLIIVMVVTILISLAGLVIVINGSLEMYPTAEQIEKSHIVGWGLLIVGIIATGIDIVLMRRKDR